MSDLYLLVSEGPSDIAILKAVAGKLSAMNDRDIEIRELSPARDQTTNRYPRHGWKEVKSWCIANGDATPPANSIMANALAKLKKNWKALVAISKAKGLIIQLDTDIAHHLKINGSHGQPGDRAHCHAAILSWLGLTIVPQELYFLLPSFSTENWILATHSEDESIFDIYPKPLNYECISDPCTLMTTAGYALKGDGSISKDYELYSTYGQKICANMVDVRTRCLEFDAFCNYL
ncbi:hypothetical protein JD522_00440 [Aeromonas hydrophila]|uniref:hypothetical protein n=1 Tax=Aeromonas hydrophila TaxID=644 RepID=UPI00191D28B5|nr:hypothetical protein [Aeromonas hydrophila]MBL0571908.1 hypothetical protein [Aeromonas hydrophila]